jgi:hypothetical protein
MKKNIVEYSQKMENIYRESSKIINYLAKVPTLTSGYDSPCQEGRSFYSSFLKGLKSSFGWFLEGPRGWSLQDNWDANLTTALVRT